jgi:lipoic acid synthetase
MRRPDWIRTALPKGPEFEQVNRRLGRHRLTTVCTHARCPNLADCWNRGTATFMILGAVCTRACRFCSVATGNPQGIIDETEPERVAAAVRELGLRYAVLTSVDRDDLPDNGAGAFAATIKACRTRPTGQTGPTAELPLVEVLTPDFGGRDELVRMVVESGPDVFGHNIETVERLSPSVRDSRASYRRSLGVLSFAKKVAPGTTTKSGLMVGLGETDAEVEQAMKDLRSAGCDIVTIGQYLQPSRECLAVERYVEPQRFDKWHEQALALGFMSAFCGPMVRSSFHAEELQQQPVR